jgi:hypothetical protein
LQSYTSSLERILPESCSAKSVQASIQAINKSYLINITSSSRLIPPEINDDFNLFSALSQPTVSYSCNEKLFCINNSNIFTTPIPFTLAQKISTIILYTTVSAQKCPNHLPRSPEQVTNEIRLQHSVSQTVTPISTVSSFVHVTNKASPPSK